MRKRFPGPATAHGIEDVLRISRRLCFGERPLSWAGGTSGTSDAHSGSVRLVS
jgi:hypothetical protein